MLWMFPQEESDYRHALYWRMLSTDSNTDKHGLFLASFCGD